MRHAKPRSDARALMEALEQREMLSAATGSSMQDLAALLGAAVHSSNTQPKPKSSTPAASVARPAKPSSISGLAAQYGPAGLTSLTYKGVKLLDTIANTDDGFRVRDFTLVSSNGTVTTGGYWYGGYTTQWDAGKKKLTWTFAWGRVSCQYATISDRLNLTISVTNTSSSDTLRGINLFPMALRFPTAVSWAGEGLPIRSGDDSPGVIAARYSGGAVAVANERVNQPAYIGLMGTSETATTNRYDVRVGSSLLWYDYTSLRPISRSVAPGATDTYNVSLRFGPSTSTTTSLASDVYQRFGAAHPATFHWTDRRAIGAIMIPSFPSINSPNNPQGWFQDPNLNINTTAGLDDFKQRILAYADMSVTIAKSMNSQGMILWNLEGERYSPYVGDPRIIGQIAPELNYQGTIDQFFQKFRDAGLKVGVTIRPDQLVINPDGTATHQPVADPAQNMIDKITYAKSRWGCTIFYIDSNVDPVGSGAFNAAVFETVSKAFPDVLLIPEHKSNGYFSFTAPYGEVRGGVVGTADENRMINRDAFSVINAFDGSLTDRKNDLIDSVRKGNILMYHGWFNSANNAVIKDVYTQALSASSAKAPTTGTKSTKAAKATKLTTRVTTPVVKPVMGPMPAPRAA